MYESFYGLKEKPFNLYPDSDYLYMSTVHENAYTHMLYAISENKGFVIITGEIGSGKTTLINYVLNQIPQDIHTGLINNTYLSPNQFIKSMCREFELDIEGLDKTAMIELFHEFLLEQYTRKKRVVLIVDEAQNLMPRTIEEIRMLSNLESEKSHLIQIILVGQPELKYKLQRSDLKQFIQRVTVHCHIDALDKVEVENYIKYRLQIAGSKNSNLFNTEALGLISKYTHGIPRLINILCDTALVYGFAESKDTINGSIIEDVVKERAAGGIFTLDDNYEQTEPIPLDKVVGNGSSALKDRISNLEKKIEKMETLMRNFDQCLNALTHKKDEKDAVVLELFKLLKNSMESRMETIRCMSNFGDRTLK